MRAAPRHHRRDAAQREARQRAALRDQLALALHHVQRPSRSGRPLKVVKSCARAPGMLLLRGMIFSTRPPMVSRPSDSGFTSSSSRASAALRLPASWSACNAAPRATASSGSIVVCGSRPKNCRTASRTGSSRVEPPNQHDAVDRGGLQLRIRAAPVGPGRGCAAPGRRSAPRTARGSRLSVAGSPLARRQLMVTASTSDRASLAARAAACRAPVSPGVQPPVARANPVGDAVVEVIAAEQRVAAGGDHLEHAARQAQHRHVEGARRPES